MKVTIVDDERQSREVIQHLLQRHFPMHQIVGTCSNAKEAKINIDSEQPDLVFLDIAMPIKSGIEFLQEFEDANFLTIFITAHDQYVLDALRLSAVDYLLKPIMDHAFLEAVKRAEHKHDLKETMSSLNTLKHNYNASNQHDLKINIPVSSGFVIKKISDLVFVEADNTYSRFHFVESPPLLVTKPLSFYDEILSNIDFIRIHKSYLVNKSHITAFSRNEGAQLIVTGGTKLDVSRRKKDWVLEILKGGFVG